MDSLLYSYELSRCLLGGRSLMVRHSDREPITQGVVAGASCGDQLVCGAQLDELPVEDDFHGNSWRVRKDLGGCFKADESR